MIFVTVGEQLPFDRLIKVVDEWAAVSGHEVFAQTGRSDWKPAYIDHKEFLGPEEFKGKFMAAELVVAHAGMGTIISALELGKPLLVMPRLATLGEVRNDHQSATARRFMTLNYLVVAFDGVELKAKLDNLGAVVRGQQRNGGSSPSGALIATIRDFIGVC